MLMGSLCVELTKFLCAIFFIDDFHTFYPKMKIHKPYQIGTSCGSCSHKLRIFNKIKPYMIEFVRHVQHRDAYL